MAYAKPSAQHLAPNKYYLIYDLSNDKGIYTKCVSMDLPSSFTGKDYFLKPTHYLKDQVPSLLVYAK